MFSWSKNLETKIELIDTQHKKLIDIFNELCSAVNDHALTEKVFDDILKRLMDYTVYHFTDEEELMLKYNVSKKHVNLQKMEHSSFVYDIERMRNYFSTEAKINENGKKLVEFITV